MRRTRAILVATVLLAVSLPARAQSRTAWEMAGGDTVTFPAPFSDHGDPMEYAFAAIPAPDDSRWHAAPDPASIGFDVRSTLCDMGSDSCMHQGVFTYFRTTLCLPDPAFRGTVQVRIGDVDDGARVTIFDASHPSGVEPGNPFAQILTTLPHTTDDFRALLDPGSDTIVVTQVDDCCLRSALVNVQVLVNGAPLRAGLATEICNGLDDDCNGEVDDGLGFTSCGVGACARRAPVCLDGTNPPCVPGSPVAEVCNDRDDDCNGVVDDNLGMTSCGVGACLNVVPNCAHGMPVTCLPGRPRPEVCNGIDDDCDGIVDNDCSEAAPEPMPEPPPDAFLTDGALDGCHDWRCDPSLRIEGRAGPAGNCACAAVGVPLPRPADAVFAILSMLVIAFRRRSTRV